MRLPCRFGCPNQKKYYFCGMFIRKKKNPSGVISTKILLKNSAQVTHAPAASRSGGFTAVPAG